MHILAKEPALIIHINKMFRLSHNDDVSLPS
jgi:hypothetical protein